MQWKNKKLIQNVAIHYTANFYKPHDYNTHFHRKVNYKCVTVKFSHLCH